VIVFGKYVGHFLSVKTVMCNTLQRVLRINYGFSWVLLPLDSEIKLDFVSFRTSMFEIETSVCLMEILGSSLFHGFISNSYSILCQTHRCCVFSGWWQNWGSRSSCLSFVNINCVCLLACKNSLCKRPCKFFVRQVQTCGCLLEEAHSLFLFFCLKICQHQWKVW